MSIKRALHCLKSLLLGFVVVFGFAVLALVVVALLILAAEATRDYLDLPWQYGGPIAAGYMLVAAAIYAGVSICRETWDE